MKKILISINLVLLLFCITDVKVSEAVVFTVNSHVSSLLAGDPSTPSPVQDPSNTGTVRDPSIPNPVQDPSVPGKISIAIYNPLKANDLQELATDIIELLIQLGIPVIVLMIIYAGFLYVTARGNPEQISKAHNTILWTLVGAAVLLGSMVIVEIVKKTIDAIKA